MRNASDAWAPHYIKNSLSKKSVYSPYLLLIRTTAAAPNPASSPAIGIGLFAAGVSVATGFTVGTTGVGSAVGVGVGVAVGVSVGSVVAQTEVPCDLLLFSEGISYVSANGLNSLTSKTNVHHPDRCGSSSTISGRIASLSHLPKPGIPV